MITELTKEQIEAQKEYADKGSKLGHQLGPLNRTVVIEAYNNYLSILNLSLPVHYLFARSPLEAQYMANRIANISFDQLNKDIESFNGPQEKPNMSLKYFEPQYGNHELDWVYYYSYYYDLGLLKPDKDSAKLAVVRNLYEQCHWFISFDTVVIFSDFPIETTYTRTGQYREHNPDGPAYKYADGFCGYVLNGINMPEEIMNKGRNGVSAKDILSLQNVEQRGEAIKWFGMHKLLSTTNYKVLDTQADYGYELIEVSDIGTDGPEKYLKMNNPSVLGEVHIEGVPRETKTVQEALRFRWPDSLKAKYGYTEAKERA